MRAEKSSSVRILAALIATFGIAEAGVFGCNSILGNNPGSLDLDASTSALTCDQGKKACAGTCSRIDDPAVGCSGVCTACTTPPNATAGCALEDASYLCAIKTCNDQFSDCDNQAEDGCETHTTTRDHCGSCNGACTQQFCERQGASYVCSDTCDLPNKTCPSGDGGSDCIDTNTDNANCGTCGTSCAIANGSGSCDGGACTSTCNASYFSCGGACVMASPQQCGSSCASCPNGTLCDVAPASPTYGTCVASSCTQDNAHCGINCNIDCGNEACVSGSCLVVFDCASNGGCPEPDGGCSLDLSRSPNCGQCGESCTSTDELCCSNDLGTQSGGPVIVGYSCTNSSDPTCNP